MNNGMSKLAMTALIGCTILVSACGSTSNGNSGNSGSSINEGGQVSASPTSAAGGAELEPVTLTFMTTWSETDAFTGVYYRNAMAFQEQNPHITINFEIIPYNDYNVKLNTSAAGKQLPDLMLLINGGAQIEPLVKSGALLPIDEIMAEWPEDFLPSGRIQQFSFDGKQYALAGEMSYSSTIFYNKDMLADLGYSEFPTTYGELSELAEALKAKQITPIAIGNKTGNPLLMLLSQINGRISEPDLYAQIADHNKKITDAEFTQSLQLIEDMYDKGYFNVDLNSIGNEQATDLFLTGEAAMFIDGSWFSKQIIAKKTNDLNVGFAVFPAIEGGAGSFSSLAGVTNQGIGINAELEGAKKEAALEFIKFMYSVESYQAVVDFGNLVPVNGLEGNYEDPLMIDMIGRLAGITDMTPAATIAFAPSVRTALANGLQGLAVPNGPDAESLAATVQKEVE